MRCDRARVRVSLAADGALPAEQADGLDRHLAGCDSCRVFAGRVEQVRHHLRFEPVADVPDFAPRVRRLIEGTPAERPVRGPARRPAVVQVAAAFVAGLVAGALFVQGGLDGRDVAVAAEVPARVLAAQAQVDALRARISVVERGWHPEVPERHFAGTLEYRSPEFLHLRLEDETRYPSTSWVRNDVELLVDESTWWTRGIRACPTEAQPACTPRAPRVRVVRGREPFAEATLIPLDLVVPARSFALAAPPEALGDQQVDGRRAIGVAVTAAQAAPLLQGLRPAGNLREIHPTDRVELWLDERTLVPLALRVVAAGNAERARWAVTRDYPDEPGSVVLEAELSSVSLNEDALIRPAPPLPEDAVVTDTGFRPGDGAPLPGRLPARFTPHRSGSVVTPDGPQVDVSSWTDGRAWLKLRVTREWTADRLFGDLGPLVREIRIAGSPAYLSEDGSRLAVHADEVDLVLTGSVTERVLIEAAESLAVRGVALPSTWPEASASTLDDARRALAGLLLPVGLEGFGKPAVRVQGGEVAVAYSGPGARAFLLVQDPGRFLPPPLAIDVRGVAVRGKAGRYSPERGELEWVEGGKTVSLHSSTLGLNELVLIAESLGAT